MFSYTQPKKCISTIIKSNFETKSIIKSRGWYICIYEGETEMVKKYLYKRQANAIGRTNRSDRKGRRSRL